MLARGPLLIGEFEHLAVRSGPKLLGFVLGAFAGDAAAAGVAAVL